MKEYYVQKIEVYRQDVLIKAESASQAIRLVAEGKGDEGEMHYDHTLNPVKWLTFEVK